MNKIWNILPCMAAAVLLGSGCDAARDQGNPEQIVTQPVKDQTFISGQDLVFEAEFFDDTYLLNYELRIVDSMQEHFGMEVPEEVSAWVFAKIYGLEGQTQKITQNVPIPLATASGRYVLRAVCTDNSGNNSKSHIVEVVIQNGSDQSPPNADFSTLDSTNFNMYNIGDSIDMTGPITDNGSLLAMDVILIRAIDGVQVFDKRFDLPITPFPSTYKVPAPNKVGDYTMYVVLRDGVNNIRIRDYLIRIS